MFHYTILASIQWISSALEFPYPVRFFCEGVAGGRVKPSPARASWWQELQIAAKSWRLLYSTTHHALTEKPNGIRNGYGNSNAEEIHCTNI